MNPRQYAQSSHGSDTPSPTRTCRRGRARLRAVTLALTVLCQACVPEAKPQARVPEPLPSTFASSATGPSIATIPWKRYLDDATLHTLVDHALENNFDVSIAVQRVELARAYVTQATGAQYPQVGVGASAGIRKFGLYTMDGAGNITTDITPGQVVPTHLPDFALGIQSTWELDFWGKLKNQKRSAVASYLASIEAVRATTAILVADLVTAYYDLLAADAERNVFEQSLEQQRQAAEIVHWQKQAGQSNELAVQQFKGQVLDTEARLRLAERRVSVAENQIHTLLGRFPTTIPRSAEHLFPSASSTLEAGVPSDLLRNRPDLRAAELQVQASRFSLEAARAAFYPSFEIGAAVGLQAFNPRYLLDVPESLTYGLSASVFAPLVNREAIEADFHIADASHAEALYAYQKAVLLGYVEVANSLQHAATSRSIHQLKQAQRHTAELAVETSDALYRAGKATYLEVLLTQQNQLAAQLQLVEAAREVRVAQVEVYRALGGGWR